MKKQTKITILFISILLFYFTFSISSKATDTTVSNQTTKIILSQGNITVDGENISRTSTNPVYLSEIVETHTDLNSSQQNITNSVINITKAGIYEFTGTIENAQIAVNAPSTDEITIILNNTNITCQTAPAIIIYQGNDPQTAGKAGIHIQLADGTTNTIVGSHIPDDSKHIVDGVETTYTTDYDAAISSDISIEFSGNGTLIVDSDNEGIETKMHLTINEGNYQISSNDDAINASEDNVSVITINNGTIYANIKETAKEGDGIDSNGSIYINGGTVYAFASEVSGDSGLDSDDGIYINGGTVIGTGNMADAVNNQSTQAFLQVQFSQKQTVGTLLTILDKSENPIIAFQTEKSFSVLVISTPQIIEGEHTIYTGGSIQGESEYGLYTTITSYEKGTLNTTTNTGSSNTGMMRGGSMQIPEGEELNTQGNTTGKILGIILLVIGVLAVIIVISSLMKNSKNKTTL